MATIAPTPVPAGPAVPDSSNSESTFDAQWEAFNAWAKNYLQPGVNALADNVKYNADEAKISADIAVAQAVIATDKSTLTAADRLQTGLDRSAAAASANTATEAAASISSQVSVPIHDATSKTTPVDADEIGLVDSAASNVLKKLTWSNLKATLATWINGGTLAGSFTTINASAAVNLAAGVTVTGSAALGYGTGAGGTVTQATSKATSVAINKPCGVITTNNGSLASGASVVFAVSNSLVTSSSICYAVPGSNPSDASYAAQVIVTYIGGFYIRLTNISAGALSEAVLINFAVIKGATS